MQRAASKVTAYYGERDRLGDGFLADALMDLFARRATRASATFRGVEGFGVKHQLRTAELLSLSEDLPMVTTAVDTRAAIEDLLDELTATMARGLLTVERAHLLTGRTRAGDGDGERGTVKLTVSVGRRERYAGQPAYAAIVGRLHAHGIDGATVLPAIDGTVHGVRHRAAFFSANAGVPLQIVCVGEADRLARVLSELTDGLPEPLATLERVTVCKRDGVQLRRPPPLRDADADGLRRWQQLTVYVDESATHDGRPVHGTLVRRLREAGARGATTLRGFWGYHGDHAPHGERLLALRRHAPVVVTVIDRADCVQDWYDVIDELTPRTGLVTCETVPALLARGDHEPVGGLRLASIGPEDVSG